MSQQQLTLPLPPSESDGGSHQRLVEFSFGSRYNAYDVHRVCTRLLMYEILCCGDIFEGDGLNPTESDLALIDELGIEGWVQMNAYENWRD